MGVVITRSPRTRQPQWAASAGSNYPTSLLLSGSLQYEAASGKVVPPTITNGTRDTVLNALGLGVSMTGANSTVISRRVFNDAGWTVVLAGTAPTTAASMPLRMRGGTGEILVGFNFDRSPAVTSDGSLSVMVLQTGVQRSGARAIGVLTGAPGVYVVRHVQGQTPRMWANGLELSVTNPNSDSFSAAPTNADDVLRVVGDETDGANAVAGITNLVGVISAPLAASACASLSANPWQLFAPLPRRIWVPPVPTLATLIPTNTTHNSTTPSLTFTY